VQVPLVVAPSAAEHTSHPPPHALLQHTPSAQKPLVHWPALEQLDPRPSLGEQWLLASQ
jgi:hypothetical protein